MTITAGREVQYSTYTGEKFRTLETVKPLAGGRGIFLCRCGQTFECSVSVVRRGRRSSCGCRAIFKDGYNGGRARKRLDLNDLKLSEVEKLAYSGVWVIDNKFEWSRYGI